MFINKGSAVTKLKEYYLKCSNFYPSLRGAKQSLHDSNRWHIYVWIASYQ